VCVCVCVADAVESHCIACGEPPAQLFSA
jgi:hypothetical protein